MGYSVKGSYFPDGSESAIFQLLFQNLVEASVKLVKVRTKRRFPRKLPGVVVAAVLDDSGARTIASKILHGLPGSAEMSKPDAQR
jgi:hypothetical protein